MLRTWLPPTVALAGVALAIVYVSATSKPAPVSRAAAEPADAPYRHYVAGAAIVEARSENIAVGTPVAGVVLEVLADVGGVVRKGDPLFRIDARDLEAQLAVRRGEAAAAKERLARLRAMPRPEEIPAAEARAAEAEAVLGQEQAQLLLWESVTDKRAVSVDELTRRRFAVKTSEAQAAAARADVALLKAGAWAPDLAIAEAEAAAADSQARAVEIEIDRRTVRAPIDAEVLQRKVRPGEFAPAGVLETPLFLLGDVGRLHARVDVDENEIWRFRPGARATGFVRGNRDLHAPLEFVRIEPYVVPKRSLTGDSTERVDTRVMQAIFTFDRQSLPVLVGQQIDVFVEAASSEPASRAATTPDLRTSEK